MLIASGGKATDLKQFNLADYKLQLAHQNQSLLELSGSGTYDTTSEAADLQLTLSVTLARLLETLHRPDVSISSGSAELKGHVTQKQKTQTVTGNLVWLTLRENLATTNSVVLESRWTWISAKLPSRCRFVKPAVT